MPFVSAATAFATLDCTVSASMPGLATRTDTSTLLGFVFVARVCDETGPLLEVGAVDFGDPWLAAGHVAPHTARDWSTAAWLSTEAWLFGTTGESAGAAAA
jgi:hypothetical protein